MRIKVQSEDGQDFVVECGEGRGSVGIASWHCGKPTNGFEHFTVEEAKAAVAVLEFAIKIAEVEREEMEKRNGH